MLKTCYLGSHRMCVGLLLCRSVHSTWKTRGSKASYWIDCVYGQLLESPLGVSAGGEGGGAAVGGGGLGVCACISVSEGSEYQQLG